MSDVSSTSISLKKAGSRRKKKAKAGVEVRIRFFQFSFLLSIIKSQLSGSRMISIFDF